MPSAFEQLKSTIEGVGTRFSEFKTAQDARLAALADRLDTLQDRVEDREAKSRTPGHRGGGTRGEVARKGFSEYLRKNDPSVLDTKDVSITGGESAGSGTVPTFIANEILDKAVEVSPLINEVRRTTSASGDYKRVVNRKGATSGWVAEDGTRNATATPVFRTIAPPGGELYAYPAATSWMLNDSKFDIANLVISDTAEEFALKLTQAILTGTASDQPYGMLKNVPVTTADDGDARDRDTLRFVTSAGSPSQLDSDVLITALFDLSASYRRGAIWVMSSATLAAARKLKDNNGAYLWQPNLGAAVDSGDGVLLGKRVVIAEEMAASGSGDTSILVGDFRRGYELVEVGGMQITRDDNITTPGFVKWYVRQRFLGRLIDNNAIRAVRV